MSTPLGLPRVSVLFSKKAKAAVETASNGRVALVVKDADVSEAGVMIFNSLEEAQAVTTGWTAANKKALELAFYGNPAAVMVAALTAEDALSVGYSMLESRKFDVCTVAGMLETYAAGFIAWAKDAYDTLRKRALFLVAGAAAPNHPAVVKVETSDVVMDGAAVDSPSFVLLPLIAGVIAGQPLWQSVTYQALPIIDDSVHLSRAAADEAIAAGKLILYHDGEKVKIARGVTSLTSVGDSDPYSAEWRKIKVVRILNRVEEDIRTTIEDNYIGKIPNTIAHRQLLLSAVEDYLVDLEQAGVLLAGFSKVDFDLAKIKAHLKTKLPAAQVDAMDEAALREADTDDKLFLIGTLRPVDAIEDVQVTFAL